METATTIGLIALGVVAIVLVMSGVTKLTLRLMKRPLETRITALYGPDEILMKELAANNFGLESWGVWQGRGNGALVLTMDCLHFFRFVSFVINAPVSLWLDNFHSFFHDCLCQIWRVDAAR